MKKKTLIKVFTLITVFVMGFALQGMAQNQAAKTNAQKNLQNDLGYCLDGITISPELQTKITKMQQDHQTAMTPLRLKLQGTRDWTIKTQTRKEMDALKAKHQEEIWALVPEARGRSLNLRQGTGRGQGYPGQGLGRAGYGRGAGVAAGSGRGAGGVGYGRGAGAGYGRGAAVGRGAGRGYGRGGGRGAGRGYVRGGRIGNTVIR
ncbi:MAG: hypothetical protein U9N86_11475 [Bacteroidota bacterium]|nr:hypothetical protein [Bacteroidota bacterium]